MDWINIDNERPECAEWVLALCTKGSCWLTFRAVGGWYINTNYGQYYIRNNDPEKQIQIAYWSPIPKLPIQLFNKLFPNNGNNEKSKEATEQG